jgi:hypothetical protein
MSNFILRLYCAFLLLSFAGSAAIAQNFSVSPSNEIDVIRSCTDSAARITVTDQTKTRLKITASVSDTNFVLYGYGMHDTVSPNYPYNIMIAYDGPGDSATATLTVTDGTTTTTIPVKAWTEYEVTPNGPNCGIDFGVLSAGQTRCATVTFKNTTSGPLVIDSVDHWSGPSEVTGVPPLPLLMLAGESVVVGTFCLTGVKEDQVYVHYTTNNQSHYASIYLRSTAPYDPWAQKPCLQATMDSTLFGPVIVGGSVTANITIANNRLDTITIGSAQFTGDAAEFSLGVPLPVNVMPHTSQSIPVVFSTHPQDSLLKSRYIAQLQLVRNASACTIPSFTLPAVTLAPTDTTVAQQLFPNQTQTLAMLGGTQTITRTFYFTNNSGTKVKVDGVTLANTSSFSIVNISPGAAPFTLNNGDRMSVTISLNTTSDQVYYDELIITTEQGAQSLHVPIQGLRSAAASVPIALVSSDVSLRVVPNPAMNDVTISANGINVNVGIFDLLGNPLATAAVPNGTWRWDGTANGARVPSGNYVVRVSGIGMDGKAFVNSKMLEMR